MSEYIKKDPLIEIAEQQGHVTIDDIINEPPANVAPIQYGQWILRGRKILCSKCRATSENVRAIQSSSTNITITTYNNCSVQGYTIREIGDGYVVTVEVNPK